MMMTVPAVSVVVPVYNRLDLVIPVLDAFAVQRSNLLFEVIVVDDGSDPPAATVMAGRNDQFRLVVQPNRGRAAAVNAGLTVARGEIVIICDADIVPAAGFIEEHVAFHRDHPAVEDTYLGEVIWGVAPPLFAALLGPRSNPRMEGLEGRVPWIQWYTDNWSFKRSLVDHGLIRFDETFHAWGWEDLELAHRLAAKGIRNVATPAAAGRHLQTPTLDGMLRKFAGSVPNLLHLATCIGRDEHVDGWLALRRATPPAVQAGEAILRYTVARVESIADRMDRLGPALRRILSIRLSDAVFRCGIQRGFLESQPVESSGSDEEVVQATMLPHADLVQTAIKVLVETEQADAARSLLDFSRGKVAEVCGAPDLVSQFIRRAMPGRPPIVRAEH